MGEVAGVSSYILDGYTGKCVCLATSGRLLLGVDIMTGFSCNDSLSPHRMQTQSHIHTHVHTDKQLVEHLAVKPYLQKSQ